MSTKKSKTISEASSSRDSGGESVVIDCGQRSKSSCGYCRSSAPTSISHGLLAESLAVDDYQALLDRGWRRSGCYLYKPDMERTCCPSYTIRLKASDFVPFKEQTRVSRRMERFLDGKLDVKKPADITEVPGSSSNQEVLNSAGKKYETVKTEDKIKAEPVKNNLADQIDNAVQRCIKTWDFRSDIQVAKASVKKVLGARKKQLSEGAEELLYTSNIAYQLSSALRHKHATGAVENNDAVANEFSPQTIAEKLAGSMDQLSETSFLSVKACNGHINFFSAAKDERGVPPPDTVSKKTKTGNEGKSNCVTKSSEHPHLRRHKLEISLKRSSFDREEHALYKRYQLQIHNDTPAHVTEKSYRRFLVDTPLKYVPPSGDGKVPPCGFGSFHQQYRIDGQLVAVGVVDILPNCLSSKYLFWDPDYGFLSLGKYSALQEINWVRENQSHCPSLQYYYLGYYIHSCSKMRYKAAYRPSELLCPLRYQWVPMDIARPLLDKKPYVVLSDFANLQDGESVPRLDPEDLTESTHEHEDTNQGDTNNHFVDYDDDMVDADDSVTSDSDSDQDSNNPDSGTADRDVSNVLLGLQGSGVRYREIQPAIAPAGRKHLESLLRKYRKVVGGELSERMVYDLR